ncbi:MAG: adenylate/guanylate cyclase domain-containing protein, partial [Desulfobacteraceae bacterium]
DGIVVKFIGDAGLIVYPADNADPAVCNLKELKDNGDNWLSSHGADCQQIIKAHIGPAMCGYVGTKRTKRFDVFGNTVTKAALVQSDGFAVTPQLFQKLTAKTQTMFKEHKSTITFRPAEKN